MRKFLALALFTASVVSLNAQKDVNLSEYTSKYKNEQFVILETTEELTLDLKKGELLINKSYARDILYLTDKASMFNESSVGFGFFNSIEHIEARTYSPNEKGKLKSHEVREFNESDSWTSGIFHDDSKTLSFSYPQLTKGAQTHLSYDMKISNERFSDGVYFSAFQPTEKYIYKVTCHPDIDIIWKEFNLGESQYTFTESTEGNNKVYIWTLENLELIKSEENTPAYASYCPHIVVYPTSYKKNGETIGLQRDVSDLFSWYNELINGHLEESGELSSELKKVVDDIKAANTTELEQIKEIFYWTQDNIKYVAFEEGMNGFIPRPANKICDKKYGDCKDMASIINGMARYAGIKTYYVWIGSRDIPYTYSELPTLMVDNHMIAAYKDQDGKVIFMDATGKQEQFGTPTSFIQGKEALLRTGDNMHELAQVPVVNSEVNNVSENMTLKINEGKLTGTSDVSLNGYYKGFYNMYQEGLDENEKKKMATGYFRKGNNKNTISVLAESQLETKELPSLVSYEIEIEDYIIESDNELIVNMNLETFYKSGKLDKDRQAPREFEFLSSHNLEIDLEIPEGYTVSFLPENRKFEKDGLVAEIIYTQTDQSINYQLSINCDQLLLEPAEFDTWNSMVKLLKRAYKDAVVLKQNT